MKTVTCLVSSDTQKEEIKEAKQVWADMVCETETYFDRKKESPNGISDGY